MKLRKIHRPFALLSLGALIFALSEACAQAPHIASENVTHNVKKVALSQVPLLKESDIVMPKPSADNALATLRTTRRLETSHYRKINLNDEFSLKVLNRYLDSLDYNHNTFLQSDIEQIREKYGRCFDDELKQGKLDSAFAIYQLMAKRRYERYAYALSLLAQEPNLADDDKIEIDREKAPWPQNTAQANALWKDRVENDVINQKLKGKSWPEIQEKLTKRYNLGIRRLTQTHADDITQLYLNAFAREIDPHTSYLAPRSAKSFDESMNLSLEGIGATLQMEDDETVIKSLVTGAPAARSKQIKAGDKIIGVGQSKDKIEDVVGWRLSDVVDKVKGKKGSKVYLEIEPEKGGKSKLVVLERDTIRLEDQAAKLSLEKVENQQIGVIKIPSFYMGLTRDVRQLLAEVKQKKVDALIIDLRENGGGSLKEVIELSGLFITDGPIVQVRDAQHNIRVYEDPDHQLVYAGPLLVMINRYSASASEIFAAAMQDYQRALILGQNSYGKGTVQQSRPLLSPLYDEVTQKPIGILQYTIQKFYRVNGCSTQIKGVKPDITFPEIIDAKEYGEEQEDNALPWDRIPSAFYLQAPSLTPALPSLREKHQARMAKDPEFIVLNETLAERKLLREKKYFSLQYAERKAENDKDEAKRLKDLNARFKREGKAPLKNLDDLPKDYEAPDFFLTEAEKIAVDLIRYQKAHPQHNQ